MRRHLRWYIGALLLGSTIINYIDRQALSVLAPILKTEHQWTNQDFAFIVIAFRVAYALMQVVSGRLVDRLGSRTGLTLSVVWYSTVTVYVAIRGAFDIKQMLHNLKENQKEQGDEKKS